MHTQTPVHSDMTAPHACAHTDAPCVAMRTLLCRPRRAHTGPGSGCTASPQETLGQPSTALSLRDRRADPRPWPWQVPVSYSGNCVGVDAAEHEAAGMGLAAVCGVFGGDSATETEDAPPPKITPRTPAIALTSQDPERVTDLGPASAALFGPPQDPCRTPLSRAGHGVAQAQTHTATAVPNTRATAPAGPQGTRLSPPHHARAPDPSQPREVLPTRLLPDSGSFCHSVTCEQVGTGDTLLLCQKRPQSCGGWVTPPTLRQLAPAGHHRPGCRGDVAKDPLRVKLNPARDSCTGPSEALTVTDVHGESKRGLQTAGD